MVSDTTITFVLLCGYNTSQRFATSHCVVPKLLSHCSNTQTWRWSSQQLLLLKFSHHSVFHVQRTDVRAWLPQAVLLTLPFNVMIQTYLEIKHFQLSWRLACPRHLPWARMPTWRISNLRETFVWPALASFRASSSTSLMSDLQWKTTYIKTVTI